MRVSLEARKKISDKLRGVKKTPEAVQNMKNVQRKHLLGKEKEICDKYINGLSIKKLAPMYNSSEPCISKILKENGVKIRSNGDDVRKTLSEEDFQRAVQLYESGLTLKQCAKEIGSTYSVVRARFMERGIHIRTYSELERGPRSKEVIDKIAKANKGHRVNQKSIDALKRHNETVTEEEKKIKYEKAFQSRKKSAKFCKSKIEEEYYKRFQEEYKGNTIIRQYKDDRYPFACDFYIKELDLFIEINAHWTHGRHPFDPDNEEDIKKLEIWKERSKASEFYSIAIKVWTVSDPLKIKTAKENNLNYITIY